MTTMIEDKNRSFCHDCERWMARQGKSESGNQRYVCGGCSRRTTQTLDESLNNTDYHKGYDTDAALERVQALRLAIRNGANRFVVTTAVNNSPVEYAAWKSLKRFCSDRGAHLIVIPISYKNISLYTANQEYTKKWTSTVEPYLIDEPLRIGNKCWVKADIGIQATAANPLSGMAPLAGDKWCIFGHSQMALEPIPTPLGQLPGRMYTTGAITQKSYSRTKVGAKASFHHVCGALYIEVDNKRTFIRQLNADHKGHIADLTDLYTPDEVFRNQPALSLTTGDEHVKWMRPNVKIATYTAPKSLVNVCKPTFIVRHDVLDGYAGSHHHLNSYITQYKKWYNGDADYKVELDQVVQHIDSTTPVKFPCTNVIITDANHHEHLDSWLHRADDRTDHINADLISMLRSAQRAAVREGKSPGAFQLYIEPRLAVPTVFTDPNMPFMIGGVDFGQHGHRGANGARGSAQGFANTTHKATIGHTHAARIVKSVHQVAKSCEDLEYETGLSSHTNTHSLQYKNGKRTMIDILQNFWRARNKAKNGQLPIPTP